MAIVLAGQRFSSMFSASITSLMSLSGRLVQDGEIGFEPGNSAYWRRNARRRWNEMWPILQCPRRAAIIAPCASFISRAALFCEVTPDLGSARPRAWRGCGPGAVRQTRGSCRSLRRPHQHGAIEVRTARWRCSAFEPVQIWLFGFRRRPRRRRFRGAKPVPVPRVGLERRVPDRRKDLLCGHDSVTMLAVWGALCPTVFRLYSCINAKPSENERAHGA